MSSFVPLNLIEDQNLSKKDIEAEHTRELQVEQGFKLFEDGLTYHRQKQYQLCYDTYEALFKLDVLANHYTEEILLIKGIQCEGSHDKLNLPPNVKSLRYLVFRNRAFLYLDILRQGLAQEIVSDGDDSEEDDSEEEDDGEENDEQKQLQHHQHHQQSSPNISKLKHAFYTMMDDMGICLIYQEADEQLLATLYDILVYLDAKRLARFALEYTISSKNESDDLLGLLPLDKAVTSNYKRLLDNITQQTPNPDWPRLNEKYGFMLEIRYDYHNQIHFATKIKSFTKPIHFKSQKLSWYSLTTSINDEFKHQEDKTRIHNVPRLKIKDIDPYYFTMNPIEVFKLETPDVYNVSDESDNDNEEIQLVNDNGNDNGNDYKEEDLVQTSPQVNEGEVSQPNEDEVAPQVNEEVPQSNEGEAPQPNEEKVPQPNEDPTPPPETEPSKPDSNLALSPTKSNEAKIQRSSKRLQKSELDSLSYLPNINVETTFFTETIHFFNSLHEFFGKLPYDLTLNNVVEKFVESSNSSSKSSSYQDTFIDILNSYDSKLHSSSILLNNTVKPKRAKTRDMSDDEHYKLLEVLRSFGSDEKSKDDKLKFSKSLEDLEHPSIINSFVEKLNNKSLHITEVRISILRYLLGYVNDLCPLSDYFWPQKLYDHINTWVIQLEPQLLYRFTHADKAPESLIEDLCFTVSLYELLTNTYVQVKSKVDLMISQNTKKGILKNLKVALNAQTSEVTKLKDVLERWKKVNNDLFFLLNDKIKTNTKIFRCFVRFKWCFIHKEKVDNANFQNSNFISLELEDLALLVNEVDPSLTIPMANHEYISYFSLNNINGFLSTVSVLTMFARILYSKDDSANSEAIYLLERTLIDKHHFPNGFQVIDIDEDAIQSIKLFLDKSSIDTRVDLWNILFLYYDRTNDFSHFQFGFERCLESFLGYLISESYHNLEHDKKQKILLRVFAFLDEYFMMFLPHLSNNNWILNVDFLNTRSSLVSTTRLLLQMFEVLYFYSLHEEAAMITAQKVSVWTKSKAAYDKFKDMFMRVVALVASYYFKLHQQHTTDGNVVVFQRFLRVLHEQLGLRRLCDSGNGILLQLFEDILLKFGLTDTETDLLQIMSCKYHCTIVTETFTPTNHETASVGELNETSTRSVSKFVLPLCLQKNPLDNPPRGDLKILLDEFYEVIGDPDFETSDVLIRNDKLLNHYLDSTIITPTFFRDCFHGLAELNFDKPQDDKTDIVDGGLYYIQGLLIFQSFKIRKKSMQGRSVELDNIVTLLQNDLAYSTNRVESWFILGQAYEFLTEDDLIWTSDKLTIIDRKITTANLQRKSLLCYLMAINYMTKSNDEINHKSVIGPLMSNFAKNLFSACMVPMDMLAFKVLDHSKFVKINDKVTLLPINHRTSLKKSLCLKVIQQCLHVSIKIKPDDWTNYYYLSKVQGKLKMEPDIVIDTLLDACKLALKDSSSGVSEPIIEPHYRLCSIVYKYFKANKLSSETGISSIHKDTLFKDTEIPQLQNSDINHQFCQFIVNCLMRISHYDKKKWHHKYRYRLAKIWKD